MRGIAWIAGSICAALSAGSALAAEKHGWVILEETPHSLELWDQGGVVRRGDEVDISRLRIWSPHNKPREGVLEVVRASCEWGSVQWLPQTHLDETGRPISYAEGGTGTPHFYGPHGWLAPAITLACDTPDAVPAGSFPSADAVFTYAGKLTHYPAPSRGPQQILQYAPSPPLEPAYAGPYRFTPIVEDPALGNVAFLDWASVQRSGDVVTARTLIVLDDGSPPPQRRSSNSSIFLRRFDCKAGMVATYGQAEFRTSLGLSTQDSTPWPVRSTAHWRLGARLLAAACTGAEPPGAFTSLQDAAAYQGRLPR
jgi:hypothetical protein